ncbi:MAG: GNAT family N-acetyltransferase [Gemmatimonadetes bacterium]|nr:GNAT family N-acetyltransferase [Gemmatimonadota bacterium]
MKLSIRECGVPDIDRIVGYFLDAHPTFLDGLGVDPNKLPEREVWRDALVAEAERPLEQRERHYVIWEIDGVAVGHSNLSEIQFGVQAHMHLHMWDVSARRWGSGTSLVRASIDRYFELFRLENLFSEPYALNPAANRTLPKLGFRFLESYDGVPGPISYPQPVNRWRLTREEWEALRRERA